MLKNTTISYLVIKYNYLIGLVCPNFKFTILKVGKLVLEKKNRNSGKKNSKNEWPS